MFLYNRSNLASLNTKLSYLFTLPQKITSYRFLNTIGNSRSNISAHYDISNDMFAGTYQMENSSRTLSDRCLGFLSEDMTYSCAIFDDLDGDLKHGIADRGSWSGGQGLRRLTSTSSQDFPTLSNATTGTKLSLAPPSAAKDELHAAQLRKLRHIIQKARIFPRQRILEIGSGWGALAILIAQTVPDTTIDTLTLSSAQQELANRRIADAGLSDRITVHLMDYRVMPGEWEGIFDRVVSVEMAEAVGMEFLDTYWGKIEWAMKRKGAVGVVQCITIPEPVSGSTWEAVMTTDLKVQQRFERYMTEIDFIRKWVRHFRIVPMLTH
jgi:cyclopropane-fatty-acyl-phospholipid synthase